MVKTFVNEQYQGAQTKRYIRIALERLDSETKRAQEAERRALELADRFRAVNEARVQAQTDLVRANEELRLWKTQYDNAQNELRKGQQMLRDVESQRDDAEASAAEARSVARKIREKHLVLLAREEGRKQGQGGVYVPHLGLGEFMNLDAGNDGVGCQWEELKSSEKYVRSCVHYGLSV